MFAKLLGRPTGLCNKFLTGPFVVQPSWHETALYHSTMIRSAHSTRVTKIAGLPNFAFQLLRSVSVTPRAREQAPQEKTGILFATTFSRVSLNGGHPTGMIASAVDFRIRYVASPVRKICTS